MNNETWQAIFLTHSCALYTPMGYERGVWEEYTSATEEIRARIKDPALSPTESLARTMERCSHAQALGEWWEVVSEYEYSRRG